MKVILPTWLIDDDIRSGQLRDVLPKWEVSAGGFDSAAWFAYPSRSYVPQKVRAFIEFMRAS